ncbi:MAG TPA: hypothetical protein VFO21_27050 [Vicinamibacterales bacterium]|nr:hypothetical protein [Vicinamibacterales bacterium]
MLITYIASIGTASTVCVHGSGEGVSSAAATKINRTAYRKRVHRKRAVITRSRARNSTSVGS